MVRYGQSIAPVRTAYVAILAMLLLFIAPTISKHLAHSAADPVAKRTTKPAMLVVDKSQQPHSYPLTEAERSPMASGMMMDDSACGYCQLLIHVPLLRFYFTPVIWLIRFNIFIRRHRKAGLPSVKSAPCRHRCRAPPSSIKL